LLQSQTPSQVATDRLSRVGGSPFEPSRIFAILWKDFAMSEEEQIRKTVGPRPEHLTVFERLRRLNAFVRKLNIKDLDDGEHIRRVVGPSRKK
jgi:hypothetical protein